MATFTDLEEAAPAIGQQARERFERTGLCFLATVRADGSPRVSPVEVLVHAGGLYLGMMPGSAKARDLQRDPRCALMSPLADRHDTSGEVKVFGTAREVHDPAELAAYLDAFRQRTGEDTSALGPMHLFEIGVEAASWQRVEGDTWRTTSWRPGRPVRERGRTGPSGEVRDLPA